MIIVNKTKTHKGEYCKHDKYMCIYVLISGDNKFACQKVSGEVIKYVSVAEDVSSKGYSTFGISESNDIQENNIFVTKNLLENISFKIRLDEKGNFTSVFD